MFVHSIIYIKTILFLKKIGVIGEDEIGNWGRVHSAAGQGRVIKWVGVPSRKAGQPPGSESLMVGGNISL